MKNDYHYIDHDHAYTDPETGVLRNRENINDANLLLVYESLKVSFRLEELQANPFREGNGRTQREFLRLLAMEKGLSLNLNPPDNEDVYERYMSGTIDGNVELLAELILESGYPD